MMAFSNYFSKWTLGGIAAGALVLPSSLFLLWKAMKRERTATAATPSIPLYGESRAREEKFIFIDEDYVGVVLGRHLRNIRKIEHETRTFINLISYGPNELHHNIDALRAYEDAASNWDNEEELPSAKDQRSHFLRVHAQTKEQIVLVELAIDAMITDAKRRKNKDELKIPAESIGYVIGKGGDRIRKLSRQFRVRCQISQEGGEYETILLEGTPEGIEGAKTRILEMVDYMARPAFGEEEEISVDEQVRQMLELKEKLEDNTEMCLELFCILRLYYEPGHICLCRRMPGVESMPVKLALRVAKATYNQKALDVADTISNVF
ncbi:tofu-7 [Pristionchus pacificus]|uniref:Tofu-7 n=1 Tax=Pristionchus pacificus TaxID=54126 RepID=A0A2A6B4Y6_PRIPA|nr:tofu-7 [Pristionchus pacificus]|eukprot:PDM60921.1 tofu-7 [Pristionchus pacificus]